jgi:hypothetical protein
MLSPSYRCHEWDHRISRAGAREETRIRKLRDLDAGKGDLLLIHMLAAMSGDADDADEGRKHQHSHAWRCRRREKTATQAYPEWESIGKGGKAHRRRPVSLKCSDHPMTLTE